MVLDGIAEHGLVGVALGAGVERRRQLLQRFFPPVRNEPPPHGHQLSGAVRGGPHDLDCVGRGDVVVRLQIASGAREIIKLLDFAPRVALSEASARADVLTAPKRVTPLFRDPDLGDLDQLTAGVDLLLSQCRKPMVDQTGDQCDAEAMSGEKHLCRTVRARVCKHRESTALFGIQAYRRSSYARGRWRPISGHHNVGCNQEPKRVITDKRQMNEYSND